MMAATSRGVAFVAFGDDETGLLAQLRAEFPQATLLPAPASSALDAWVDALCAHLDKGAPRPDLPLDLKGTAFQLSVWRFLLSVPEGELVSYADVASGIGAPRAVRAAASACGANRLAVLVPCHRVLRGDGGIGGYRWGISRKRALIAGERR
jgi:AraC family transcriptional regulator of adaptative response/methylated-DNA-[protein]-cysteine methyltransferase